VEAQPAFLVPLQDQVQPSTDHLSATAISDLHFHHLQHLVLASAAPPLKHGMPPHCLLLSMVCKSSAATPSGLIATYPNMSGQSEATSTT
jgi:hypothetical protein